MASEEKYRNSPEWSLVTVPYMKRKLYLYNNMSFLDAYPPAESFNDSSFTVIVSSPSKSNENKLTEIEFPKCEKIEVEEEEMEDESSLSLHAMSHDHDSLILPHAIPKIEKETPLTDFLEKSESNTILEKGDNNAETIITISEKALVTCLTDVAKSQQADPDLDYFKSILPFYKKLNDKNRRQFIRKTTNLCMELVDQQEDSTNGDSSEVSEMGVKFVLS